MKGHEWVVVTAVGKDRPGLVNELSGWFYRSGGNLEDSRMALLGGEFAIILLVRFEDSMIDHLRDQLSELEAETGLSIQLRPTEPRGLQQAAIPFDIQLVGQDHQGIVHQVTCLLAAKEINVVALETRAGNAPVTGVPLFTMHLRTEVPQGVSTSHLRHDLQELAEELNVDIEIHPATS